MRNAIMLRETSAICSRTRSERFGVDGRAAPLALVLALAACGADVTEPPPEEVPMPVCGNGVVEDGEECDDGNLVPGDGYRSTCLLEDPPAAKLFAGGYCTCAVFPAGNVRCWGGDHT